MESLNASAAEVRGLGGQLRFQRPVDRSRSRVRSGNGAVLLALAMFCVGPAFAEGGLVEHNANGAAQRPVPPASAVGESAQPDVGGVAAKPVASNSTADSVAASAADSAVPPSPANLAELMKGMRSATGVVAHFTETKELALLSTPLEATGAIYFLPPDRLVRVVTSPGNSRLVVDGDVVRFEDETGQKAMELSSSSIARQLIDSFVVLFNGNEARLAELYTAEYSAGVGTWSLHLSPKGLPLSRMISSFDLTGSGSRIDRMEAVEPDGDRTVTRFGETEVQHHFSAEELAELFGEHPAS